MIGAIFNTDTKKYIRGTLATLNVVNVLMDRGVSSAERYADMLIERLSPEELELDYLLMIPFYEFYLRSRNLAECIGEIFEEMGSKNYKKSMSVSSAFASISGVGEVKSSELASVVDLVSKTKRFEDIVELTEKEDSKTKWVAGALALMKHKDMEEESISKAVGKLTDSEKKQIVEHYKSLGIWPKIQVKFYKLYP